MVAVMVVCVVTQMKLPEALSTRASTAANALAQVVAVCVATQMNYLNKALDGLRCWTGAESVLCAGAGGGGVRGEAV